MGLGIAVFVTPEVAERRKKLGDQKRDGLDAWIGSVEIGLFGGELCHKRLG